MQTTVQEYKYLKHRLKKFKDINAPLDIIEKTKHRLKKLEYCLPAYSKISLSLYMETLVGVDTTITFIKDKTNANYYVCEGMFKVNGKFSNKHLYMQCLPEDLFDLLMKDKMANNWIKKRMRGISHVITKEEKTKFLNDYRVREHRKNLLKNGENGTIYKYNPALVNELNRLFDLLDGVRIDIYQ